MRILAVGLLMVFLISCGGDKPKQAKDILAEEDTTSNSSVISTEAINDILQQIPAPLEISVLLKESGKKYNASYLNPAENLSKYNTNYKKALNLGIYGCDLGYTNIYEKNQDGVKYMSAIKELADGLNIGQFFDLETIARLASNSKNLDSLLLITTQNFNNINAYLQNQNRSNLSVLLLAGGWIEAVSILGEVATAHPENVQLRETIGEQKIILKNISLLLQFYEAQDQNMASLLSDVRELEKIFDAIKITYTYKEPTSKVVDGILIIEDNSTSTIEITTEDVAKIRSQIAIIRNKIIS